VADVHQTLASFEETKDTVGTLEAAKSAVNRMSRSIQDNWEELEKEASANEEPAKLLRVIDRLHYALDQRNPEALRA